MKTTALATTSSIVLVGHGAIPKDYPRDLVARWRALQARRRDTGTAPTAEELDLEHRLRHWPRTLHNDPYRAGLMALADQMQTHLPGCRVEVAYLEFCAPSLDDAIETLRDAGLTDITVVPSMLTAGGVHSEVDIPEILEALRQRHPDLTLRYAWPVDPQLIAQMLVTHVARHQTV